MFLVVRSAAGTFDRQNVACINAGHWRCTDLPAQYTSATTRQCCRCTRSCTNANRTSRMRTADVMARSISKCASHRPHRMAAGRVAGLKGKQRLEILIKASGQCNNWQICGGISDTGTRFSPNTSVFPCQYHSTIAPYSSIHLPPTLYNVFLTILQFSPVRIIQPLLHTHPSNYHSLCIMIFSQYFSFPLSLSFNHCSILIHPSTTHDV